MGDGAQASCAYEGWVRHRRFEPVTHALSETLATDAPRAPGAPRAHDAKAFLAVGLRGAKRSGTARAARKAAAQ